MEDIRTKYKVLMKEDMRDRKVLIVADSIKDMVIDYITKHNWIVDGKVVTGFGVKFIEDTGLVMIKPLRLTTKKELKKGKKGKHEYVSQEIEKLEKDVKGMS